MGLIVSVSKREWRGVLRVGCLALGATGCVAASGADEGAAEDVASVSSAIYGPTLPAGWVKTKLGPVPSFAYANYDPTTSGWDIKGGGAGLFATPGAKGSDNVYFVNKSLAGDGEITFMAQAFGGNPEVRAMIRSQPNVTSSHAAMGWGPNLDSVDFVARPAIGGVVSRGVFPFQGLWFKLTRRGDVVTGYTSFNGFAWQRAPLQVKLTGVGAAAAYGVEVAGENNADGAPAQLFVGKLPWGLVSQDIGGASPAGTGTVDYDVAGEAGGTVTVAGGGSGVKGTADSFQFAYRTLIGDGTLTARLQPPNGASTVKSGLMLRKSLASNASQAFVAMDNSDRLLFNSRLATSAATSADAYFSGPYGGWVRLVRTGTTVATSSSVDGTTWTPFRSVTINDLGSTVYVGVAVASGGNGSLGVGELDNLRFQPANPQ